MKHDPFVFIIIFVMTDYITVTGGAGEGYQ